MSKLILSGWLTANMHSAKPYWVSQKDLAKKLAMSADTLNKLVKTDPTFPKKIKLGNTRQAPVYYLLAEVEAWLAAKKSA